MKNVWRILGVLLFSMGCRAPSSPDVGNAALRVVSAAAAVSTARAEASIEFTVENLGTHVLSFDHWCSVELLRQTNTSLSTTWIQGCIKPGVVGLLPGAIVRDTLRIVIDRGLQDAWPFSGTDGTYRLKLFIRMESGETLAESDRLSNLFTFTAP